MRVLMINGSPNEKGCTYTALTVIAKELERQGVESEIVWLGKGAIHGCTGCGACRKLDKCVYDDDVLNQIAEKARTADGYVFGAPVHYASPCGAIVSALDRLFMSTGSSMQLKPAASIVSARRAGTTASYDVLNKYIGINNMLQVPSVYWNMVHGSKPDEVFKDEEGVSIMRAIGSNMAWLLKLLQNAKGTELEKPEIIPKIKTNFIR